MNFMYTLTFKRVKMASMIFIQSQYHYHYTNKSFTVIYGDVGWMWDMPRNYYKKVIVEYPCPNIVHPRILPRKIRFSRLARGSVPRDQCPRDLCPRNMSIEYHPGYCPRNMSEVFSPGKHPQVIIARVMRPEFNYPSDLSRSKFPGIMSTAIPPRYTPGYFLFGGYFQ